MEFIISFVILHYKDIKSTDSCVRSILNMHGQEHIRIVIVDNDIQESEEDRRKLADRYKKYSLITVLPIRENGGFSYGNNCGYRFARENQKASFIVMTNNDIVFSQENFVYLIKECYESYGCDVIGPDIIQRSSGKHQNPMAERVRTAKEAEYTMRMNRKAAKYFSILYPLLYWKIKRQESEEGYYEKKDPETYRQVQKNKVLYGACLVFTPSFVSEEEKAFWPETKFFYEEYILAKRCQNKGYETIYEPAVQVIHESGAATQLSSRTVRNRIRFQVERIAEASEIYLNFIE